MRTPRPWILPIEPSTRARLVARGVSDAMIATAIEGGRLRRLRQGVYVSSERWPSDPRGQHLLLARAELAANPEAVLSHESAAVSWGLPSPGFTPWHQASPSLAYHSGGAQRALRGRTNRHTAKLAPSDVARDVDGYPVTSLARTATDLAAGRPLPDALVILDGASRLLLASLVGTPRRKDYASPRLATQCATC